MNVQSVQQPVARQSETPRGAAPGNRENNCALARAKQFIDDHFRDPINLERITTYAGLSRFTLAKQFRQRLGVSPHRCLCAVRVQYAQSLMEKGLRPTDIASEVGFFDQSHLIQHFIRACGMTPRRYMSRRCRPPAREAAA